MSNQQGFQYTFDNGFGHLHLSRPQVGNRVSIDMLVEMTALLRRETERASVLTITAEGADFCVGRERAEQTGTPVPPFEAFRPVAAFYRALSEYSGVTIAAVQGRSVGFGAGLGLRTDITVSSADATFTLDEIPHGIPPMFVLSELVDHMQPKHLMDLVMTGRTLSAAEALAMGMVSRIVPGAELQETASSIAAQLASQAGLAALCKRYIRQIREVPQVNRLDVALSAQTLHAVGG